MRVSMDVDSVQGKVHSHIEIMHDSFVWWLAGHSQSENRGACECDVVAAGQWRECISMRIRVTAEILRVGAKVILR